MAVERKDKKKELTPEEEQELAIEEELKKFDKRQLYNQIQQLANQFHTAQLNQEGLIKDNDQLQNQIKAATEGKMIYGKLLDVKAELGAVGKDQTNSHQGFKFRGIDQFVNHLHPVLNKHRVGISTKVLQNAEEFVTSKNASGKDKVSKNVRLLIEYTFFAEDGSTVSCQMPAEGVDTSDKATNKALSAALKYCLIQCFMIPTEDMEEADKDNVQIATGPTTTTTKGRAADVSTSNEDSLEGGTTEVATVVEKTVEKKAPAKRPTRRAATGKAKTEAAPKKSSFRKKKDAPKKAETAATEEGGL